MNEVYFKKPIRICNISGHPTKQVHPSEEFGGVRICEAVGDPHKAVLPSSLISLIRKMMSPFITIVVFSLLKNCNNPHRFPKWASPD